MQEIILNSESRFTEGEYHNSTYQDGLLNQYIRPGNKDNDYSFYYNNEVSPYGTVDYLNHGPVLKARKLDEEIYTDNFYAQSSTYLYQEGQEYGTEYIRLAFDWRAYRTQQEDTAEIVIGDGSGNNFTVVLSNRGTVNFITEGLYSQSIEVNDTATDSVGDILNYISNDMSEAFLEIVLLHNETTQEYEIKARLGGRGYLSEWYNFNYGPNKATYFKYLLAANSTPEIVDMQLSITDTVINGFDGGLSYASKVFDSGAAGTNWQSVNLTGTFPVRSIPGFTETTNSFKLKVYSSENETDIKDLTEPTREYDITPGEENFSLKQDFLLRESYPTGRFLYFEIYLSNNSYHQNLLDSLIFNYALIQEQTTQGVYISDASISQVIGSTGGIISIQSDYYFANLYIPAGALASDTNITLTRLASDEEYIADDMIGFKLEPAGLIFKKPVMLEVDYMGFGFNTYQNEEGLRLGRYMISKEEMTELNTLIEKERKKAITYLNKF